jgi:hypothetical protein
MARMNKHTHGPSLYYATDKNIFDALNQHKVDTATVGKLFRRRNILVSRKTLREDLAQYFSRLTHDYYDHKVIGARLGVATRRERITSVDMEGLTDADALRAVSEQLKGELERSGDTVVIDRNGESITLRVQYSEIDYKRSEFNQVQVKDGVIEFERTKTGYTVRNTQNDYINGVRETLLAKLEKNVVAPIRKVTVSLFDIPSPKLRSRFFYELAASLPQYVRKDVTDVYVFKAKPDATVGAENSSEDPETHVERVFLRGNGVSRSQVLNELLDEEDYYITKMGWTATELYGEGHVYAIEVSFADPKDCTNFSYLVTGVFPLEEGKVSSRKRSPTKSEVNGVSRLIEVRARELMSALRNEYKSSGG